MVIFPSVFVCLPEATDWKFFWSLKIWSLVMAVWLSVEPVAASGGAVPAVPAVFSALDQAAQGMPLFYVSSVHQRERERDLSSIRVESYISRLCKFMQVYASFHQNLFKVPTKIVQKWRSLGTKRHKLSKGLVSQDHLVHARFLSLQNF